MDLHALSQGRKMLMVRGGIAFLVGVVVSNNPGMSATVLVFIVGLWALAEAAATLRQAYPRTGTSKRAEAEPLLLVLGGVGVTVGLLSVLGAGVSAGALTWVLAGWFALRAVFEGLGAYDARSYARFMMGTAAVVDLGLVAMCVTHTSGTVVDLALFGGGLAALWGVLHLLLGVFAKHVLVVTPAGPRLLAAR